MNFAPKVGPLVAELLSGFALILLAYFALPQPPSSVLHENAGIAVASFSLIAWLLGTFIDAIRNLLEHGVDRIPGYHMPWDFLVSGENEKVANLETYFLSFYRIDLDIAISLALFISCGKGILNLIGQPVGGYSIGQRALLLIVSLVFALDAHFLRREMIKYVARMV